MPIHAPSGLTSIHWWLGGFVASLLLLPACAAKPDYALVNQVQRSNFGTARVQLAETVAKQPRPKSGKWDNVDRTYLLNRLRLLIVTLADGYPDAGEAVADETYELLRTQGVNEGKGVSSVILNEDLKTWKGEPFEQAMGFIYIGTHHAMRSDWSNMRAASENALFQLRDFGTDFSGSQYTPETLARKVANENVDEEDSDEWARWVDANSKYVKSNFALGYLLNAVANLQMLREDEADERFEELLVVDESLKPLVRSFKEEDYNAVFVVDFGLGPAKVATGPDGAVAQFIPVTPSDGSALAVTTPRGTKRFPQVMDLNRIATDLSWNNMQDVRIAKSVAGDVLLVGGLATAGISDDPTVQLIGLGVAGLGMVSKAGAHADTRHCEVLPQRVYVVPVKIEDPLDVIKFTVDNHPGATLTVTGINPPTGPEALLRYIRLPLGDRFGETRWATSGEILYGNVHEPFAGERPFPFVLGGDCALPPTYDALKKYQDAGYLRGWTIGDLQGIYIDEGIEIDAPLGTQPGRHILEGGNSLVTPLPGTTGYARLFGVRHPPYEPKSNTVRQKADAIFQSEQLGGANNASP